MQRAFWLLTLAAMAEFSGCAERPAAAEKTPPARVARAASEDRLNRIELTPRAVERLGLRVAPVESKPVARRRSYGGEVMLPTAASLTLAAPVGGKLQVATAAGLPAVGTRVRAGQTLFTLVPMLSPERDVLTPAQRVAYAQAKLQLAQAQIDASSQKKQAQTQVEAAQIAFDRAEELYRNGAGTVQAVDMARAQLELAQKALATANRRVELLQGIKLDAAAGEVDPLPIRAPRDGVLRAVFAAPGEVVPAGKALLELLSLDRVWVRVPVYAGEVAQIARDAPARIHGLTHAPHETAVEAEPVPAPPTAVPQAAAVDLYYALPNPEHKWRPGQRVTATLPLRGEDRRRVVPRSALVYDIHGGAWVYERLEPRVFARRRVSVPYTVGDWAVLDEGPAVGATVAVTGVAELFGAEFGVSH